MTQASAHTAPVSSSLVAGALVTSAATGAQVLHLSLPRIPLRDRRRRRWLRDRINAQVAEAPDGVSVVFHRIRRGGTPTNKAGWLAWL